MVKSPLQQPLDIISDVMALSSYKNAKNVIVMGVEVRGPFDEAAFRKACAEIFAEHPGVASVLKEARNGWRRFLIREPRLGSDIPVTVSELPSLVGEGPLFGPILEHLAPRLDRTWQLFSEPPVEMHVVQIGPDHRVLGIIMHHSGGDAATTLTLLRAVCGRYETVVRGGNQAWLEVPYAFSTGKKSSAKQKSAGVKDVWRQFKKNIRYLNEHPVRPAGGGDSRNLDEHHAHRLLSEADSRGLLANFSQGDLHVVDHLVACTNLALDEWNSGFNIAPGMITSVVTVNMRGRFGGAEEKNYSSAIFFRSSPTSRTDYLQFVAHIAKRRAEQFQERLDLVLRRSFAMGAALFSVLPLSLRRRVAHAFMLRQQYSAAVGYLGVVFPEIAGGWQNGKSQLRRFGDLEIVDVFGTGYKLSGQAFINLYAYLYKGQIQLVLTSAGKFLTREENERLLDLLLEIIYRASSLVEAASLDQ
jgi:hypothetical protein